MTKQFQKELKEKVKEGVKPSDIKRLKRSKSEGDIPQAPPLPTSVPVSKSQSQTELPLTQPSKEETITNLKEQVKFHTQTAANYLKSLQSSQARVSELEEKLKNNPPSQLLQNQLQEKQKDLESLRAKLQTTTTELNSLKKNHSNLLNDNLALKHQGLKDWFKQYQQTQKIDKELADNIEEASTELTNQDQLISTLQTQNSKLHQTNQSLTKDLNLATKLAESRKSPLLDKPNWDYLKLGLYSLLALCLVLKLLNPSPKIVIHQND